MRCLVAKAKREQLKASFSLSFHLLTGPGRPSQLILSFSHDSLSSQVTEDFHKTLGLVWPRFQPNFCPPCGDRSRQEGQECRKDPHPHPERRQGQGRSRSQQRRDRHPRRELFPSQPRPAWRRTCESVRFRTGSVPSTLFFQYLSPPSSSSSLFLEVLGAISRSFGDR